MAACGSMRLWWNLREDEEDENEEDDDQDEGNPASPSVPTRVPVAPAVAKDVCQYGA